MRDERRDTDFQWRLRQRRGSHACSLTCLPSSLSTPVQAITYTSGLRSSVFCNTSTGPAGYM